MDYSAQYREQGYFIYKECFRPRLYEDLAAFGTLLQNNSPDDCLGSKLESNLEYLEASGQHEAIYKASVAFGTSSAAYSRVGDSALIAAVSAVTEVPARALHFFPMSVIVQMPGDARFDYNWHQEAAYYPQYKGIINIWFPLFERSQAGSGCLGVKPGSHKQGLLPYDQHSTFIQMETEIEDEEYDKVTPVEINPMDVCIFHEHMVHMSLRNTSTRPRVSGVIRALDIRKHPPHTVFLKSPSFTNAKWKDKSYEDSQAQERETQEPDASGPPVGYGWRYSQ